MKITLPEIGDIHDPGLALAHDEEGIAIEMGPISIQPSENMDELSKAISALPELLEALTRFMEACTVHEFPNVPVTAALVLGRAALLKAGATIED